MKKITFLFFFLSVAIGYAQHHTVKELGENSPVYYDGAARQSQDPAAIQAELDADAQALHEQHSGAVSQALAAQNRDVLADIIPTAGATETFTPAVGDFFFDPGGPGGTGTDGDPGNYPNCGCVTLTTLAGVTEIEFLDMNIFATFDWLKIYDGADTSGTILYDNATDGANEGDNTLADMIASNGSASFVGSSGNLTFEFNASAVVNRLGWEVEIIDAGPPPVFPAPYCGPLDFPSGVEPISLVEVADISNPSDPTPNATPAHEDFLSITAEMAQEGSYPIALEGNTVGNFENRFVVFIDWNQNEILDDAGEVYEMDNTITNSDGTDGQQALGTIDVPVDALLGETRMRVKKIFGVSDFLDPCSGTSFGQVEEYTVNVVEGTSSGACAQANPSNGFENGKSNDANQATGARIVAADVLVPTGENFTLETITFNEFMSPGATAATVDVFIYADDGGAPGAEITSELGVVPASQSVIGSNFGFDVSEVVLDITDFELSGNVFSDTTYWIGLSVSASDGLNCFWENSTASINGNGEAYDDGLGGGFVVDPALESVYSFDGTCDAIPPNDDCGSAYAISCGDSFSGSTADDTDSGGNAAPDEFFTFTGDGEIQIVTLSLCDGSTDYDSLIRVFDDCDLSNEIAVNDDSCGVQSELEFISDGTSTYYIMIEGFGSGSGNFTLDVTCEDPIENDFCDGALPIACGETITGNTDDATFDADAPECATTITAPGLWYVFEDTSGLQTDYTVSLCDGGTDYDSKLTVYTGECGALVCETDNDDTCGLQSEVTFSGDGNTTYYILVHGFGGATGNFSLNVDCAPVPPPNDMIVNSIDVDEAGFPYTDPAVPMPAATTEDGNPAGCSLNGANGVWYNFVAPGDGDVTASIATPGGASAVTFYFAPDENATETDLTLVPQNTNQCVPGTSATINAEAGQAYYVFVLNTGAITDINIDGNFLDIEENSIEGFSYYPNPAEDLLSMRALDVIENVSIYNMLGQKVMEQSFEATTSELNISALSTGTYVMKVTVNGEIGSYKLIKK
ncbi:GEVED domain-containing protein [Luteirhabdus pelagi]|uniref:GEVED domain-containing protein n=1 Tax=Luteirhabdus pelagi TaxID=2792783 RepID=UPI00193A83D8|nr:GEVED domain-containing protein [Luteirhabdus pelagi]